MVPYFLAQVKGNKKILKCLQIEQTEKGFFFKKKTAGNVNFVKF